nr:reverse transcriptase domain-containing protein [Tanacetum cinerariifolium]
MPRVCLAIIESKSKVRYSRNKPDVAKVSMNTSTSGISPDVAELKDMEKALLLGKKTYQAPAYQAPAPQTQGVLKEVFLANVKANDAVMRNMQNQLTNLTDLLTKFMNSNSASTLSSGTFPSNTIANPRSDLKAITTQSGVSYDGPQIPPPPSSLPKVVENKPKTTKDTEVLDFSDMIASGNPTPYYDPIVSTTSPTLTPFGNSDFLLKEVDAFLALEDDPSSPKVDPSYLESEGDILLLEAFINDDPSLPPPNQGNYLPEVRKELKICEAKSKKSH